MNRNRYRLVFSATLGMQVPAAETARGRGKTAGGPGRALAGALLAGMLLASPATAAEIAANALPVNPLVKHGNIGFAQSGNTLTINQATQAGIIHWNKFNIGSAATVNFNQPNVTSATLNRITGNEASVIRGAMNATGAVYVVNRNGIVFDKGSQVNLHTLVASTLDIRDDALFLAGYRGADNQTAAFSASYNSTGELDLGAALGGVEVAEGAYITSRQGGRIILMGADVSNRGSIDTRGGQILLAAGQKAYIHTPTQAESDSLLNGIVVAVESGGTARNLGTLAAGPGGDVTLIGAIVRQEGVATATTTVNVNGTIHLKAQYIDPAATTVFLNNRPAANTTGELVFGENSRTAVMPALDADKAKAGIAAGKITQAQVDAYSRGESGLTGLTDFVPDDIAQDGQTFTRSVIFAQGKTVWLQQGASLVAPSGEITLFARAGSENPNAYLVDQGSSQSFLLQANNTEGLCLVCRVQIDAGARIDVSGVDAVPIAMARNVVEVELRGSELADSPLLHGSANAFYGAMYGDATNPLYGKKIRVDIRDRATVAVNGETVTRKGTALADASGYIAQIGRKIDEKSTAGGTVNLYSEGGVVVREGATVDFSGGSVEYQGGDISTSQLLYKGRLYDVASATPDRLYSGLAADRTVHEDGYVEGRDAGTLRIVAPAAALQGTLKGHTVAGRYQRGDSGDALPRAGELILGFAQTVDAGTSQDYRLMSKIGFGEPGHDAPDFDTPLWVELDDEQKAALGRDTDLNPAMREIVLDAEALRKNGIGHLAIYTNNAIELAAGQKLDMGVGGSVTLTGAQIDIDGTIDAPGGTVSLSSQDGVYNAASARVGMDALALDQHIAIDGAIRTAGQWTNDYLGRLLKTDYQGVPVALNGGSIGVNANDLGDLTLGQGSLLDASAGAWLKLDGKTLKGGKGGDIGLEGDGDVLSLAGALQSYGVLESGGKAGQGGTLSLRANQDVRIGGGQTAATAAFGLGEDFFSRGGFSGYAVASAQGRLTLADNTRVAPRAYTRVVSSGGLAHRSGPDLGGFSRALWLDRDQVTQAARSAADLSLAATDLVVGKGASIDLDALADLALSAGNIDIEGDLSAPAGSITLKAGASGGVYAPNVWIWLGSDAALSVAGIARTYRAGSGLLQGEVLDGGSISLLSGGSLMMESGARLDASGTVGTLDLPDDASGGVRYVRSALPSAGGTIRLAASEGLFLHGGAVLKAQGGSDAAAAGSLRIELDRTVLTDEFTIGTYPTDPDSGALYPHRLYVSSGSGGATPDYLTAPGTALQDADDASGVVSASHLENFDTLELKSGDRIVFKDSMSIALRGGLTIDAPNIELADSADAVTLRALAVNLGNGDPLKQSKAEAATTGEGVLNVSADLIDLSGTFALQGVKQTSLASAGDVRLVGVVDVDNDAALTPEGKFSTAGDLAIRAAQTYAATLSEYVLESTGPDGKISFAGWHHANGGLTLPYAPQAAGGSITVSADSITQAGVLRAPVGSISLDAGSLLTLEAGSLTSVSADGLAISFGRVLNGTTWVYDFYNPNGTVVSRTIYSGSDEIVDIPSKRIALSGDEVDVQQAATVDLSGGGDLVGSEFAAGAGGSSNYLATDGVFAIVPAGAYSAAFAAADYQANHYRYTSTSGGLAPSGVSQTVRAGETVYLSALPELGIEAGFYAILPAQYALLPGAYAVRAVAGSTDMTASQNVGRPDGSYLVAGYTSSLGRSDTGTHRWSGFEVASRAVVATHADFSFNVASETLDSQTLSGRSEIADYRMGAIVPAVNRTYELAVPRLAADAGRLSVSAARLALDGSLDFGKPVGGLGGELDIASGKIAITDGSAPSVADAADYLVLDVDKLASYEVDSLMIGGTREAVAGDASVLRVNQVADAILVETGTDKPLSAPEVMLVSRGSVTLAEDSEVRGEGEGGLTRETLLFGDSDSGVSGDGVLVRASSGALRGVVRRNVSRSGAVTDGLYTAANALVAGEKSVNLDATYAAFNLGKVELGGEGALQLGATRVALGEVTDVLEGVFVTNELLDSLGTPQEVVLKSYSNFDVHGDAALGNAATAKLTLQGAGFAGKKTGTLNIAADTVIFANADGIAFDTQGASATGSLEVDARSIHFGAGAVETAGFDTVTLTASDEIGGFEDGQGGLTVSGDLAMSARRIVGYDGSDTTFRAGGMLTTALYAAADQPGLGKAPLGARMSFIGGTGIDHGGNIEMPAGWLSMTAETGDLDLLSGSNLFTGGVVRPFHGVDDDVNVYVAGGLTELEALAGDTNINAGATVDVSGRDLLTSGQSGDPLYDGKGSADAGSLSIYASGNFTLQGELKGDVVQPDSSLGSLSGDELSRRPTGAVLVVDANSMSGGVAGLQDRSSGFAEEFSLRLRNGDLLLGAGKTIASERVNLAADAGVVDIAGTIDAQAPGGGWVMAAAGRELYLRAGAVIDAAATGEEQRGGEVWLIGGMDKDYAASDDYAGALVLENGSRIAVSGTRTDDSRTIESVGGRVHLQAPRLASGEDARITQSAGVFDDNDGKGAVGATIVGASLVETIGNRVFEYSTVGTTQMNAIKTDSQTYMASAGAARSRLGGSIPGGDGAFHARAGVEVRSPGDLEFSKDYDLGTLTDVSAGEPGVLTLRAAGNLLIDGSLSDGFNSATGTTPDSGDSWSYRLVAGSDLSAADPMAVKRGVEAATGDFVLAGGKQIRSGTGSIQVAAAGAVEIGLSYSGAYDASSRSNGSYDTASVVYTAGRAETPDTRASKPSDTLYKAYNTVDGGAISIAANGDIHAPEVVQLMNQWLVRRGDETNDTLNTGLTWGIDFRYFDQGVGALGGGDVRVRAGGEIENLSVSLPTTGRDYATADIGTDIVETGGGDLSVVAGGDIRSAVFHVQQGEGRVVSGAVVAAMPEYDDKNLLLALGDATFQVDARAGLTLESAFNPTLVPMGPKVSSLRGTRKSSVHFSTYAADSGVELVAAQGDVVLNNKMTNDDIGSDVLDGVELVYAVVGEASTNNYLIYPGSLKAAAVNGDLQVSRSLWMHPSASGQLHLLAAGNVAFGTSGEPAIVSMSDQSLSVLSTVENPGIAYAVAPDSGGVETHAAVPVHAGDTDPVRVYAEHGNIAGHDGSGLTLPKSFEFLAGRDITDVEVVAQNLGDEQTSFFRAARDIRYATPRIGGRLISSGSVSLGGAGYLEVVAGRDIDLGTSGGIVATGNLNNANLDYGGADIVLLAGMGAEVDADGNARPRLPDYASFLAQYDSEAARADYYASLLDHERLRQALLDPDNAALSYAAVLARLDDAQYRTEMTAAAAADYAKARDAFDALLASSVAAERGKAARLLYFSELQEAADEASLMKQLVALGFDLDKLNGIDKSGSAQAIETLSSAGIAVSSLENFARFFDRAAALNEANGGVAGYSVLGDLGYAGRADKAIDTLLPAGDYAGNFNGFYSQVRTEQASDIAMLTPGGSAVVGLVNAEEVEGRADSTFGLYSVNGGSVSSYSQGDFLVNTSRVFTLGWEETLDRSGDEYLLRDDIFLYSAAGDVDAGKGAKTVSSTPPPTIITDDKGITKSDIGSSISGSGIAVLLARPVINRGSTYLIAPNGEVNAGDAGIRASGNLFIDANRVVGADNIVAVGVSIGVPTAVDTSGLSVSGIGNIGDAGKAASDVTDSIAKDSEDAGKLAREMKDSLAGFRPSLITVDVLGFGSESTGEDDEEKRRRAAGRP